METRNNTSRSPVEAVLWVQFYSVIWFNIFGISYLIEKSIDWYCLICILISDVAESSTWGMKFNNVWKLKICTNCKKNFWPSDRCIYMFVLIKACKKCICMWLFQTLFQVELNSYDKPSDPWKTISAFCKNTMELLKIT